jgi:hypothetical protein
MHYGNRFLGTFQGHSKRPTGHDFLCVFFMNILTWVSQWYTYETVFILYIPSKSVHHPDILPKYSQSIQSAEDVADQRCYLRNININSFIQLSLCRRATSPPQSFSQPREIKMTSLKRTLRKPLSCTQCSWINIDEWGKFLNWKFEGEGWRNSIWPHDYSLKKKITVWNSAWFKIFYSVIIMRMNNFYFNWKMSNIFDHFTKAFIHGKNLNFVLSLSKYCSSCSARPDFKHKAYMK